LDNKNSSSGTAIDQPSKEQQSESKLQKQKNIEDYIQYSYKELSMLVYNPWKILHLKVMGPSLVLVVAISLDQLYWTTRILLQALPLISHQNNNNLNQNYVNDKNRRPHSEQLQSTINVGVQSL
jgi:hypothetical protein